VTNHADKPSFLEPDEAQKLKLQLALRDCELNIEERNRIEAELRLYEFVLQFAQWGLPQLRQQLKQLEGEGLRLTQHLLREGERIKAENGWPAEVQWDPLTLIYSISMENTWTTVPLSASENKIRIQ
jgi:hypothetical protein